MQGGILHKEKKNKLKNPGEREGFFEGIRRGAREKEKRSMDMSLNGDLLTDRSTADQCASARFFDDFCPWHAIKIFFISCKK